MGAGVGGVARQGALASAVERRTASAARSPEGLFGLFTQYESIEDDWKRPASASAQSPHDLTWAGDFPLNLHGGYLFGQAGMAGGMSHVTEAVRQIAERQVPDLQLAYAHGNGGIIRSRWLCRDADQQSLAEGLGRRQARPALQQCDAAAGGRACPTCGSAALAWSAVSGRGRTSSRRRVGENTPAWFDRRTSTPVLERRRLRTSWRGKNQCRRFYAECRRQPLARVFTLSA